MFSEGIRRRELMALVGMSGLATCNVFAQDFPTRPVKLVIPQGPGSGADATGRQLADFMAKNLNGSVVVDNKPGANGILAASTVAKERPDGYTVFLTSVSIASFNQQSQRYVKFTEGLATIKPESVLACWLKRSFRRGNSVNTRSRRA